MLLIVGVFWKELLYATFDPQGAAASGLRVAWLEYLFLALVALTIVISLQAVGIILVVAMLVTPAAAAQLLTVRFGSLMALAIVLAVASSVAGPVPVVLAGRGERGDDRPRPDRAVPGHPRRVAADGAAAPVPPRSRSRAPDGERPGQPGAAWVVGRSRRSASVRSTAARAARNWRRCVACAMAAGGGARRTAPRAPLRGR